jgi:hypothetical protein
MRCAPKRAAYISAVAFTSKAPDKVQGITARKRAVPPAQRFSSALRASPFVFARSKFHKLPPLILRSFSKPRSAARSAHTLLLSARKNTHRAAR